MKVTVPLKNVFKIWQTRPLGFKDKLIRFDWSKVKVAVTSQNNSGIHITITTKDFTNV